MKLFLALAALAVGIVAAPLAASGPPRVDVVEDWAVTPNLTAIGFSPNPVPLDNDEPGAGLFNSDLAFWGDLAFQGSYDGFRIVDVTKPSRPKEIAFQLCEGNQGDVVVWDDVLVRSYNSPAAAGATCDGQPIPEGFEGLHIFDISNLEDPKLVGDVELSSRPEADAAGCGSHTATGVPDLANDRLIVYNQTSGGDCPFISIIEVPLDDPGAAAFLRNEPLMEAGACHDSGVILGKVNKLVCASHSHANVFDIGENERAGGSLTDPEFLFHITEPGVGEGLPGIGTGNWHSAAWTWDGEVIVLGWEPGGGSGARCSANGSVVGTFMGQPIIQQDVHKSYFFYDAETGRKLGQFVLPRDQALTENCTIHNYTVVPLKNKAGKPRYVLVAGNYQAGISVVEFSDPANAREIAYADPPPIVNPDDPNAIELAGDWSTYWYNGRIYESDISRGLLIWRLNDPAVATYLRSGHLNPQTQEFSIHR